MRIVLKCMIYIELRKLYHLILGSNQMYSIYLCNDMGSQVYGSITYLDSQHYECSYNVFKF